MISVWGWLGNFFILTGLLLVAYKRRSGFVSGIVGNSLWCIKGILTGQFDLIAIELIIVALQAFSWWNWGHVGSIHRIHSSASREQ